MRLLTALFLMAAARAESIDSLAFMRGCWAFDSRDGRTEEHWTAPSGGTMLGISRAVSNNKTVFTEYAQIREEGGSLLMLVQLGLAQKQTAFKLASLTADQAVFVSDVDFPKRLIYRNEKDGSLFARTEGIRQGKAVSEDYPYKKAECR